MIADFLLETLIYSDRRVCGVNRQLRRCFISTVARLQPSVRALNQTISTHSLTRPNKSEFPFFQAIFGLKHFYSSPFFLLKEAP
jgi:hypothetical protein